MELIVFAAIIALVIFGLEHNRSRAANHPHLYGTSDVQDRDTERVSGELLTR
jgi:hypothetical protein